MIEIDIIRDAFDIYSRHYSSLGDYSATTVIDSPRRVALFKRYGEQVEVTPESQAASLVGTAVHDKMEQLLTLANVKHPHYLVERSVVHPVNVGDGLHFRLLGGKFDILKDRKDLIDIKTCKTWKLIFDPHKTDWTKQLNIYRYLLEQRHVHVETLTVVAFYLDWIESQALRNKQYPQSPICEYAIDVWPFEETERFVLERMNMHYAAESMKDKELPKCSAEETWENAPEYAVFKNHDAKRAMKCYKDCDLNHAISEATQRKGVSKDSYLEIRYQNRKRCDKYCSINGYCDQYQTYVKNGGGEKRTDIFELGGVM